MPPMRFPGRLRRNRQNPQPLAFGGDESPQALTRRLQMLFPLDDQLRVVALVRVAQDAHSGQVRKGGQPYVVHPLRVAISAATAYPDGVGGLSRLSLCVAALAHDILEDAPGWTARLRSVLVGAEWETVVLLSKSVDGQKVGKAEYWERIAASEAGRALKVEDRIDNLRFLHHSDNLRWRGFYLDETEERVLPLADEGPRRDALAALIAAQRERLPQAIAEPSDGDTVG